MSLREGRDARDSAQCLRLSAARLADQLAPMTPQVRQVVRKLREVVLGTVPQAAESVRFGCLCYFYPDAPFGAIGGNICMIEVRRDGVVLSFIQGVKLPDPHDLLGGRGKAKRFVSVASAAAASNPQLIALLKAAAALQSDPPHRISEI